jgi:hypothetical protein
MRRAIADIMLPMNETSGKDIVEIENDKGSKDLPAPIEPPLDHFLQAIVGIANNGIEVGVTLTISGFLVSGIVVSGKRYFDEHLGSAFVKAFPESSRHVIRDFLRTFASVYDPMPEDEDAKMPPPVFIHLMNARFFHNSGRPIPNNEAIWWRGRLSDVQGFHMGNLHHPEVK